MKLSELKLFETDPEDIEFVIVTEDEPLKSWVRCALVNFARLTMVIFENEAQELPGIYVDHIPMV